MRQYMNELGMPLGQGGHEDIEPAHTETQNRVLRLSTPSADYDEPTTSPKTRHEQNLQVLERQEVAVRLSISSILKQMLTLQLVEL